MFAVDKQIAITGQEQIVYDHFLHVVKRETYASVLERFRQLMVFGLGYSDDRIWQVVEKLVLSKQAERDFPPVINRCCYILINHWQMQIDCNDGIRQLIKLLIEAAQPKSTCAKLPRRFAQLIALYTQGEDFQRLRRLDSVINATQATATEVQDQPLRTLITRYPYLYEHSLISDDRMRENIDTVQRLQAEAQQESDHKLSQYLAYQVRRARIISQHGRDALKDLTVVPNPSLMTTKELGMTFGQFAGKAEGESTYRDLSQRMLINIKAQPKVKLFKDDLYEYLISGVDRSYGKRAFNDRLFKKLREIVPERDGHALDEVSLVRTCTQVINYLVVESNAKPQHFVFADLITNIGATFTTGLLLKIVLICHKTKPVLENRLSILFDRYESSSCANTPWLVKVLESWNVAGSIHFGRIDRSVIDFFAKIRSA
jgi:hypothetical protein